MASLRRTVKVGGSSNGPRIRTAVAVLAVVAMMIGHSGCDSKGADEEKKEKSGPTVLATAGELQVTMADYEAFMERSRLFAPLRDGEIPPIPPKRKASPRIQMESVRSILKNKIAHREASKRKISVADREVEAFISSHDKLSRFVGKEDEKLSLPEGLSQQDLQEVARDALRRRKLRDAMLEEISDEELWEIYRQGNESVRIAYVEAENSPTPDEIDAFIDEQKNEGDARIRSYLEKHGKRYRMPKLVKLAIVRPEAGADVEESKLKRAAKLLDEGASAASVAETLALAHEDEAMLVRKENREAFDSEKGATGYQMTGPRGAYAWRVEGWKEGGEPKLDRALRREVAADILRESLVPSTEKKLASVLEAMRQVAKGSGEKLTEEDLEPVADVASAQGLSLETTGFFAKSSRGNVPGLGLAEPVGEAAFQLDASNRVVDRPILSRGRAVALMLLEHNRPSREAFDKKKDDFRAKIVKRKRRVVLDKFVGNWMSENKPVINMKPVREKYGTLEKK